MLETELPPAEPCDPACAVYLPGETQPISVWRDRLAWQRERQQQFPGSEPFWDLLQTLFAASWRFQSRDPVLPPRSVWDLGQLLQALRPDTLVTVPHTFRVVTDALKAYGLESDRRLRTFFRSATETLFPGGCSGNGPAVCCDRPLRFPGSPGFISPRREYASLERSSRGCPETVGWLNPLWQTSDRDFDCPEPGDGDSG